MKCFENILLIIYCGIGQKTRVFFRASVPLTGRSKVGKSITVLTRDMRCTKKPEAGARNYLYRTQTLTNYLQTYYISHYSLRCKLELKAYLIMMLN